MSVRHTPLQDMDVPKSLFENFKLVSIPTRKLLKFFSIDLTLPVLKTIPLNIIKILFYTDYHYLSLL